MQSQSHIKLLIFDFDGTLAQTKRLYFSTIYSTLQREGYRFAKKQIKNVLGLKLYSLFKELAIKNENEIKKLKDKINNYVIKKAPQLKPCPYIDSINKLHIKKVIVTNSLSSFVEPFVKKHQLKFDKIIGAEKFNSKQEAFLGLFKEYKILPKEAVYISDRAQDIDIARDVGCKSAIISNICSWSSIEEIKAKKPDYILKSLSEIKKLLR